MARKLCTGNYVAGYTLASAGEANRFARGCVAGGYPITPQTEIMEYLRSYKFTKGIVQAVESEHSAMGMCIGASLAGARSFTASSANGLAYMTENVYMAGYCRLPIVMVAVNRALGPPWNIWVDQGDTLALRDTAWLHFYCESHQDVADTILLAFRVSEDPRILLPSIVAYDGFIISHTSTGVDLPEQEQIDRFLPPFQAAPRLDHNRPIMVGAMVTPEDTAAHRVELAETMNRVPSVFDQARDEFKSVFGRLPDGAITGYCLDDAETVLIASNSIASTVRGVVDERRQAGEKVGLLKIKMFRPFPRAAVAKALANVRRVGVIDRNVSVGSGGIFWLEVCGALRSRKEILLQGYMTGLGGGDVTPSIIEDILEDLKQRTEPAEPIFKVQAYEKMY
ncbi:MAG TPA: pyruvate ferredoxin oxidoreductase [Acidobacteriota bacterium]|nr:pyruvate ferredoxin oxidoreductase [Acidobacteriota bacterium]